jgi:acetoin utilization deacetylase AcuC-like enzyme
MVSAYNPNGHWVLVLYYCDHHALPLPPGHKFPVRKYAMVRERLASAGGFDLREAPSAQFDELALGHDPDYVRAVLDGSVDPRIMRRVGFPWSPDLVRRSLASVGGTLAAAREALRNGIGGSLAGGTHHAFRAEGSGFCVFNDLAVTIYTLRRAGLVRRAAVLDLDVHQGDGTASIFAGDPEVLTVSIHGQNNFPFRKQTSSIDIGLADGTGDTGFLAALETVLPAVWDFAPDLLLYQSGVDALAEDRLGRLAMTHAGLSRRDRLVFEGARHRAIPVAVTMGGGYGEPVETTVDAHVRTFHTAGVVLRCVSG